MKRILVLVLALTVLSVGTASAMNVDARTSLTIHKKALTAGRVLVSGKLRSGVRVCIRHKVIRLYRVKRGHFRVLARTRTDRRGRYHFMRRPATSMVVYTRFAGSFYSSYSGQQVCRPSKSRRLRIP